VLIDLGERVRMEGLSCADDLLEGAGTIGAAIEVLVERFPQFECMTLLDRHRDEQRLSLRTFWRRAKDFQAALAARGVGPGDTVLLVLPTGVDLVTAYFGAMFGGAIPALAATPSHRVADPAVYSTMVGAILDNAGARAIVCDEEVATLLARSVPAAARAAVVQPAQVEACAHPPATVAAGADDIAAIQYSSGTTGTPKGVMLTHRAILNYIRLLRDGLELAPGDVNVNWAPLYHDMGLIGAFLLPLLCGCPTVLIPTMDFLREPSLWLWAIHHYGGAVSWAPNFAYAICARRIPDTELEGLDLSSWRLALNASEPVLPDTVADFAARFAPHGLSPAAMTSAWGLAETVMVATAHPVREPPLVETIDRRVLAMEGRAEPSSDAGVTLVATGRSLPRCEMEVRDADGRRLPDRHLGEVWLRTNCLFAGYRGDPELTARTRVDGWLRSGDRGYLVDGHLFFVSRDKDLIVIGGEKYAPHDIESVVNHVPGVREGCAVAFGVMNTERGTEELGVIAETRETDAERLQALARTIRLEVTRTIGQGVRWVKLVPPGGINKTTSGKLARSATYRRYAEEIERGD
jgi:acyl-CoA synthetase (AMP-forming)/AMP-acid ligase II